MLSAGTETKVVAGDDEISRFHPRGKGGVGVFQNMLGKLREIASEVSIAAGYDVVSGDVIAQF
jgi:hypothetical protein